MKRIGIFLFPSIQVFFSIWVGLKLQQLGKLSLLGNVFLVACYLFLQFFFFETLQRLVDKGKRLPLALYAIKLILVFPLWFFMGNYRIMTYFFLFLLIELYQFLLFIPKLNLETDWLHIVMESFFVGGLFPLLVALKMPFTIDSAYLWKFIPACVFIYLVKGISQDVSIRLEKNNERGLSLIGATLGLMMLQVVNKGLIQGVVLFLVIGCGFVFYKRYQYTDYKQLIISSLLFLGTFLLY
ncbi:hypothetical protein IGI37_000585 [Enterococcus sp. AZ194]|uniref:hypothetical protein n=1 Tax=Enterococcus sp. AZ194 TaxID=2774629 RepID=UPI003F1E9AA3